MPQPIMEVLGAAPWHLQRIYDGQRPVKFNSAICFPAKTFLSYSELVKAEPDPHRGAMTQTRSSATEGSVLTWEAFPWTRAGPKI